MGFWILTAYISSTQMYEYELNLKSQTEYSLYRAVICFSDGEDSWETKIKGKGRYVIILSKLQEGLKELAEFQGFCSVSWL